MKHLSLVLFSLVLFSAFDKADENSRVYIATYKDDKPGAYTLIHDDFGADYARGIEQYADTTAFNRGIPIGFAVIAGECSKEDWKKAKELIKHGHQVLNHSLKHKCGKENDWCSAGNWNENDFDFEIDSSTALIEVNTGKHPAFFIFPFDLFTDTMLTYLKHKHYAGARAGKQDVLQETIIDDPFRLNFTVFRPEHPFSALNALSDDAVQKKSWAIRVVHGVQDDSWASIPLQEYQKHLDHIKNLSDENKLWVATLSDVMVYTLLRERYSLMPQKDERGRVKQISFALKAMGKNNLMPHTFQRASETSDLNTLSVVIEQKDLEIAGITQKGKKLSFQKQEGKMLFNAIPANGPVTITYKN